VSQCDQGTEFTSTAAHDWAYWNHVQLDFSRPAKPTDNAVVESFNASLRRECLTQACDLSVTEAEVRLRLWQEDYNNVRPHMSLGHRTPAEFRRINLSQPAHLEARIREA
jgi:putative transposase